MTTALDAGRERRRMPRVAAAALLGALCLLPGGRAGAQVATGKATAAGTATGTIRVGAGSVALAHAYVAGPVSGVYIVELTDRPIPEASLAGELRRGGGQGFLRAGKVQGLLLYVSPDGFVQTAIPFAGGLRGEKMLASAGSLVRFRVVGNQVSGVGSLSAEKTNQGWSYDAQFTAAVRPVQ
jgi:hypothetical protein